MALLFTYSRAFLLPGLFLTGLATSLFMPASARLRWPCLMRRGLHRESARYTPGSHGIDAKTFLVSHLASGCWWAISVFCHLPSTASVTSALEQSESQLRVLCGFFAPSTSKKCTK